MIILYNENEKDFTSLGLGVLSDALECIVSEKLNDSFTLSMTYPITGQNFNKLQIGRIILVKPNPYDEPQPFRITEISKMIKGRVKIAANHISYDMNYIPVKAINASGIAEVFTSISNNSILDNPFKFVSTVTMSKSFQTTKPYNLRAVLMGDEKESLVGVYKAEVKFDKYYCYLYAKRGKNRGAKVYYGLNMTDLSHVVNTETLYNKVFPYYHKEETEEETVTADQFKQAYIVGSTAFKSDWLSYTENGSPFEPVTNYPVQVATEGNYYQKVYCWDEHSQKFKEKIYNESVNLIQGVISPTWIIIDWSKFPRVICKANANGYYKKTGDTDWSELKAVGDTIFDANVITEGISGLTSNMIIYYSEVIPNSTETVTKSVTNAKDVILDNPIIDIETADARSMKYDRVLNLDLTSEFDEEPTKDQLKAKAQQYIGDHKIGYLKHSTTVSFVDLSRTTEANRYQNFSHIEIGDTVQVIYRDLEVDVELRVISTTYDVIKKAYSSIELGEKQDTFSSDSIQNGDNISSLSNDMGYADITTVKKLIADTVTAEYIQAKNAKLSQAQIDNLEVGQFNISGSLQVSQMTLDTLVAKMLVAENAQISKTLTAGNIKVAGDIKVTSGEISIGDENGYTYFYVDREGNVTANSVNITGGSLTIGGDADNPNFSVDNDGNVIASNITITGGSIEIKDSSDTIFEVTTRGRARAKAIEIIGGNETTVAGWSTSATDFHHGTFAQSGSVYLIPAGSGSATIAGVTTSGWTITSGATFGVTNTGNLYCTAGKIGNFSIGANELNFTVTNQGTDEVIFKMVADNIVNINKDNTNLFAKSATFRWYYLGWGQDYYQGLSYLFNTYFDSTGSVNNQRNGIRREYVDGSNVSRICGYMPYSKLNDAVILDIGDENYPDTHNVAATGSNFIIMRVFHNINVSERFGYDHDFYNVFNKIYCAIPILNDQNVYQQEAPLYTCNTTNETDVVIKIINPSGVTFTFSLLIIGECKTIEE